MDDTFSGKVLDGVIEAATHLKRKGWKGVLDDLLTRPNRSQTPYPSIPQAELLEGFVQQLYWGETLSIDRSKKNLEEGVIEITERGQHIGNGLLITDNGYFLTNKHCLSGNYRKRRIQCLDGSAHGIEKVCIAEGRTVQKGADVVLAKAYVPGKLCPRPYRIYNARVEGDGAGTPIALLTRRDGQLVKKYGLAQGTADALIWNSSGKLSPQRDLAWSDLSSIPGDSGGALVTHDGRLYGLLMAGNSRSGAGVKVEDALRLVVKYVEYLKRR